MIRRHAFLIAVLVLTLISLAIPESRKVMALQVRYLATQWWAYPTETLAHEGLPEDLLDIVRCSGVTLDEPWRNTVVRTEVFGKTEHDRLRESVVRSAPECPEACAAAIGFVLPDAGWSRAETANPKHDDRPVQLDARLGNEILRMADAGSRMDPDNALFDLIASSVLFGMHRDTEALARYHTSAGKNRFDAYRRTISDSLVEYFRVAGMPALECELSRYLLWQTHTRQIGDASKLVVYHARTAESSGRHRAAKGLLWSMMRVGRLLKHSADDESGYWVGMVIQDRVSMVDPGYIADHPIPDGSAWAEQHRLRSSRIAGLLRAHGWDDLASCWGQQCRSDMRFLKETRVDWSIPWYSYGINKASIALGVTFLSSKSLQVGLVFLVLAFLIWFIRRYVFHAHAEPVPLGLWLKVATTSVVLGLWIIFFLNGVMFIDLADWLMDAIGSSADLTIAATIGILWPVLIWTGIQQMRRLPRTGEQGRLQGIGMLAAIFSFIVYSGVLLYEIGHGGAPFLDDICPLYLLIGLVVALLTAVRVICISIRQRGVRISRTAVPVIHGQTLLLAKLLLMTYFVMLFISVGLRAWAVQGLQADRSHIQQLMQTCAK